MASTSSSSEPWTPPESYKAKCIFCRIAYKRAPQGDLAQHVYSDEEFVAFRDHRPAADSHFLVIPKRHIRSVKSLKAGDAHIVRRMEAIGKRLLDQHAGQHEDRLLGFHWTFITVGHLHLHAISPTDQMSYWQRFEFCRWLLADVDETVDMIERKNS